MEKHAVGGILAGVLSVGAAGAGAQAPLSVEQLIVDASRWQVAAKTDFRSSPAASGEQRAMAARVGLRYGLRQNLEINAGLRQAERRVVTAAGSRSERSKGFSLGGNWQALQEGRWPALVFEGRVDAFASQAGGERWFDGGALAATVYRSIDPVVLSLTASYTGQRAFVRDSLEVDPGGLWRIEPGINFAVNPEVTLFGGMALARRDGVRLAGRRVSAAQHGVSLRGGFAWAPDPRSTIFISAELASVTALGGASLQWFYQF